MCANFNIAELLYNAISVTCHRFYLLLQTEIGLQVHDACDVQLLSINEIKNVVAIHQLRFHNLCTPRDANNNLHSTSLL